MSFSQRECALAEWEVERTKRKDKLEVLQTQISLSRRNSDISQRSALKNLGETDSNNAQGYRNRYNHPNCGHKKTLLCFEKRSLIKQLLRCHKFVDGAEF